MKGLGIVLGLILFSPVLTSGNAFGILEGRDFVCTKDYQAEKEFNDLAFGSIQADITDKLEKFGQDAAEEFHKNAVVDGNTQWGGYWNESVKCMTSLDSTYTPPVFIVPEFYEIVMLVLMSGIVGTIIISRRFSVLK